MTDQVRADDRQDASPPRMKRTVREDRVPERGHEGAQRVPDKLWEANNKRKDSADGLLRDQPPVE